MRALSIPRPRDRAGRTHKISYLFTAVFCLLATVVPLRAATVTLSIVPVDSTGSVLKGNEVVVPPGAEVPYVLTAMITCDTDIVDNDGLASFSIDIGTNLQVPQLPIDTFDPQIASVFMSAKSKGFSREGPMFGVDQDVVQIAARQNTLEFGEVVPGLAVDQVQIIGQGRLLMPDFEGDFATDILDSATASVLWPNSNTVYEPQIAFGPPLKISTRWPTAVADLSNAKPDSAQTTKGSNTAQTTTDTTTTATTLPWTTYATLAAVVGGLIFVLIWGQGLFWLFGPLLMVILGVMLLLGQWPATQ